MSPAVVVTGAAGGLGEAIAARFSAAGSSVLLVDVNPEVREKATKLSAEALVCDLADPSCILAVQEAAFDLLGGWDVLINNAAWSLHRPFADLTRDEFDRIVAINQRAPLLLAQAFAAQDRRLTDREVDNCIVNVSSVNAISGNPNLVAYAGTKGALEAMTRALAVELAPLGIRVNGVRPGVIDSPALHEVLANGRLDPATYWREFLIQRPTPPTHLAEVVSLLCSPACRTVTGAIWTVDGGFTAH